MIYTLPQIIRRAAEWFPEREAFRYGSQSLSFSELQQRMHQLSRMLVELGVKRGDRVGIYMNRCLESAVAVYAIMNAGAAYVPLDPQAPSARICFQIQDCGIRHLLTTPAQRRAIRPVLEKDQMLEWVIGLDSPAPAAIPAEEKPANNRKLRKENGHRKEESSVRFVSWEEVAHLPRKSGPTVRILEQDLAYIMYTSGTTGTPKGIMHTHYSGLSYARLSAELYRLQPHDRVGNHASIHFDISTFGYFSAPLAGAATVIVSDAHTKMPASLSKLMETERLSIWYSVPLALTQLLHRGVLDQRDLSPLRWVLFGGEPFPVKHLQALMQLWPQAKFSNVYGPAEVNQCTFYHLESPPAGEETIPLGEVWDNTEMLIIDAQDEIVHPGDAGELLIRSATMMKGYWGRPDLTEKALYRHTTVPGYEAVYYRTGDLVRQQADGQLRFLGRKDRQIKTRGYRVELDAIMALLLGHEAVQDAAVFPIPDPGGGWLIEAAVVLHLPDSVTGEELRAYLSRHLPAYAVPQKIAETAVIPRTAAGKIDHKRLQERAIKTLDQ